MVYALVAQTLQLGTPSRHVQCLEMVTTRTAQAIGIDHYGIEPGKAADLVIIEAKSASATVGAAPLGRITLKGGQVVSQTQVCRTWGTQQALGRP